MTGYYWASNLKPRARAATAAYGQLYVPAWSEPQTVFAFNGSTVSEVAIGPSPAQGEVQSGQGFIGAGTDPSGKPWFITGSGEVIGLAANDTEAGVDMLPVGAYSDAVGSPSGRIYAARADGAVFPVDSGTVGAEIGTFGTKPRSLVATASTLYAALPAAGEIGEMTLSSGAVATLAAPMDYPSFVAVNSGGVIAVAGWKAAGLSSRIAGLALSPASATVLAATEPTSGSVLLMSGTDPAYTSLSTLTGVASASGLTWSSNGEQLLVAGSAGVSVLALANGAFTVSQTLAVTGVSSLASTSDGVECLLAQPASNQVGILSSSVGAWTSTGAVTGITGASNVLLTSPINAIVAGSAGLTLLARAGNAWSISGTAPLPFAPTSLFLDVSGAVLVCGTSGSAGFAAIVSSAGVVQSQATWSGSAAAIASLDGQVMVSDPANSCIWFFSEVGGVLAAQGSVPAPAGCTGISVTNTSIWLLGATSAWHVQLGAPWAFYRDIVGVVGAYIGGAWTTVFLGIGHDPSAITFDSAGTLHVATTENDHFQFSVATALTLTSTSSIPVYPGQTAGTSLGLSALVSWNGHLYGLSSASGVIVEIA